MEDRVAKVTAKWGAACSACASAKAKCMRPSNDPSAKCDRCARLFKECTNQIHRPRKKRASKPSKTAQLEQRLDGLVNLLRASTELPVARDVASYVLPSRTAAAPVTQAPLPLASPPDHRSVPPPPLPSAAAAAAPTEPLPVIPPTYNSFAPPACICRPEAGEVMTAAVQSDEELLAAYRDHVFPLLPIVVVPEGATAAAVAAERPFFFRALRTVASMHNIRAMQGQMYALMRHVAENVLLRSERSLDLVQGLLLVVAWHQHHCVMHAQMSNLLQLAAGQVADLRLNHPPRLAERTQLMVLHPNEPSPRTHEERRALLGLWYLMSCASLCFQKVESLRFSPYLRACLQALDDAREVPSDAVLVALVRLQALAERVAGLNTRDDDNDIDNDNDLYDFPRPFPRAPFAAYQRGLQAELDRLCAGFAGQGLLDNHAVRSLVCTLRVRLYEPPPLRDAALLRRLSADFSALPPLLQPPHYSHGRGGASTLDLLYRTHSVLTAWFDDFLAVPIDDAMWTSMPECLNLIYVITMLSRWVCLAGPPRPGGQLGRSAREEVSGSTSASVSASASASASASVSASVSSPLDDIKDPSARIVPGQGAPADTPTSLASTLLGSAGSVATTSTVAGTVSSPAPDTVPGVSVVQDDAPVPIRPAPVLHLHGLDNRELARDPPMLAAVLQLREHLRAQPDLDFDIQGLLTALADRMERCNQQLRVSGAARFGDGVARSSNIWDLTARKVTIMRAKLGRFTDGASAAASAASAAPPSMSMAASGREGTHAGPADDTQQTATAGVPVHHTTSMGGGSSSSAGIPMAHATAAAAATPAVPPAYLPDGSYALGPGVVGGGSSDVTGYAPPAAPDAPPENWGCSSLWSSEMFDALDPNLWMESMDWASTLT